MSYVFKDLIDEVKRRSIRDKGGTSFDDEIKTAINTSLFRISRECPWRSLRRKSSFDTEAEYTTGTGAVTVTNDSASVTVTGATFVTDDIKVGRRVALGGSNKQYTITSITGETTFTVNVVYDGTTSSTQSYRIYGTEEYNLPIQTGRIAVIWHEEYGYPYPLEYITDNSFLSNMTVVNARGIPTHYRMWGQDNVIRQPNSASVVTIVSSSTSDLAKNVTIFGTVSGYPDYEVIQSNGTATVAGSKSFSSIERISKDASTVGRITCTTNSADVTVGVLPVGDSTGSVMYKKIQLYPLPQTVYPIQVQYYKDPWRLVNDGDIHELGADFDEAIIILATAKIKFGQNQEEGDKYFEMYKDEIKTLRRTNMDSNLDWSPRLLRPNESKNRGSGFLHRYISYGQLGGYFGRSSIR